MFVKICGVREHRALEAAVAAGANAVGFVFAASSPRFITPKQARHFADAAPPDILKVAILQSPSPALIEDVIDMLRPDVVQADCAELQTYDLPSSVRTLPVLRARQNAGSDWALFEGVQSGVGCRADWSVGAEIARKLNLILAGGLNAANVGEAIGKVRPFGVDVSSGVESSRGVKEPALIEAFVRAARQAAEEQVWT